jgi:metal-responsive CopG/Arc/MetJ family transcriptional regulator
LAGTTKVLFSIPDLMLDIIDDRAEYECRSRADLIRQALREYIERKGCNLEKLRNAAKTRKTRKKNRGT